MDIERAKLFRPAAAPVIVENAYSEDQHRRLLDVVRRDGPWSLIVAQHFQSAEELLAAYRKEGTAMSRRENTHRMADANKAFAHFAW